MISGDKEYPFTAIEQRWQQFWEDNGSFVTAEDPQRPKYYLLDMFPYPSGAGLHAGHVENFVGSDVLGRYKLARGFNVLHPMGWDAFGLPAEQYAVKTGTHPAATTRVNIENFRRQLKLIGLALDWTREVNTTDPGYYRWTQWIFLKLFQHNLAYVDERPVNWCPALGTVLANEEVVDGKSEVGGHPVERRNLRQWVLRITAYADRLLEGLDGLDWPESTKAMQRNWIGRSTGANVVFTLESGEQLTVYTTRPDTLFGATYLVLSPEHPLVERITTPAQAAAVDEYRRAASLKSDLDRTELAKDKTGVFTGAYAINPVNGERIPVWTADYVLMSYGTGAIMAVPAHDERDYAFALKFGLPIVQVIQPPEDAAAEAGACYSGDGTMINSGEFSGLDNRTGKQRIIELLAQRRQGEAAVNFKLRDWLFSRQRYWGEPFPIVWIAAEDYPKLTALESPVSALLPSEPVTYSEAGQTWYAVPLPESELPLCLPEIQTYEPSGTGESPLAHNRDWVEIWYDLQSGRALPRSAPCPSDGGLWVSGRRETNTMPQWAGSCWYYLRYLDPHNDRALVDPAKFAYWGVPDFYLGGAEHAVLHLLYARFWHRFLHDIGVVSLAEPFSRLFHQGIVLGEDGEKMSKSRGNVANPDEYIASHGADSLRAYLMFMGPLEDKKPWNAKGIEGVHRFLRKVWRDFVGPQDGLPAKIAASATIPQSEETTRLLHETIHKVTEDYERIRFNTALAQMMIFMNHVGKAESISLEAARDFVRLLAPLAPHLAEEAWAKLGGAAPVARAGWPQADPRWLETDAVALGLLVNGKPRGEVLVSKSADEATVLQLARQQERFAAYLQNAEIVKVVYVPGKILNVVVRPSK